MDFFNGSHERLEEQEKVPVETWLTFLRHHPDLLVMARKMRREAERPLPPSAS